MAGSNNESAHDSTMHQPNKSFQRALGWIVPAAAAIFLLVLFPPFHVVRRSGPGAASSGSSVASSVFEPVAFVEKFWTEQLLPAARRAPELAPILADLRRDPAAASKAHARRVGVGTTAYYFARGSGRVTAVARSRLLVEIDGAAGATVALRTGPVFGNAVRDGSGLLDLNNVPELAEFNALSAELNRKVEESVLPSLRGASVAVGVRITFAGCAEAPESVGDGPLLVIVPVKAEVGS